MATSQQFQRPFFDFYITAEDEDEAMEQILQHKTDPHDDKDITEDDILGSMTDVNAPRPGS